MNVSDKKGSRAIPFFAHAKTSPANWCRVCKAAGVVFRSIPKSPDDFARIQCPRCGGHGVFPLEFDFRPSPFLIWIDPKSCIGEKIRGLVIGKGAAFKTNDVGGGFICRDGEI